jgi:S-adenosylmethionine/arginine decarboxylase-like enzyme
MLGLHWILDASTCHSPRLDDPDFLREIVAGLPDALGLTRVGEVQLATHRTSDGEPSLAALTLLAESHFSVHVFPTRRAVHADLFSCAAFDVEAAHRYLQAALEFERAEVRLIERGGLR